MKDLIKTNSTETGITVSGRELHEFLEVKSNFTTWFNRMCEYGFTNGIDYVEIWSDSKNENATDEARNMSAAERSARGITKDYEIKLDMAKEIAMIQRNEKGKQARQYFIQVEKAWNSPEMIMKRALEIANKRVENLQLENSQQKQIIGELKPKADYTDLILQNKGLVTITQIAKDYGMSGQALNSKLHELGVQFNQSRQWLLYSKYHDKGYTHSETVPITHKDGTKDISMTTKWTQKGRLFLYDLLKENGIIPIIEKV